MENREREPFAAALFFHSRELLGMLLSSALKREVKSFSEKIDAKHENGKRRLSTFLFYDCLSLHPPPSFRGLFYHFYVRMKSGDVRQRRLGLRWGHCPSPSV
jgi:hypothetical protein